MQESDANRTLKEKFKLSFVIWAVLLSFQLGLLGIAFALFGGTETSVAESFSFFMGLPIFMPLTVMVTLEIALALFLPPLLIKKVPIVSGGEALASLKGAIGRYGQRIYSDAEIKQIALWNEEDQQILFIANHWLTAMILRFAMLESVAIIGFVGAKVAQSPFVMMPYLVVSITMFIVFRPNFDKVVGELRTRVRGTQGIKVL